MPKNGPFWQSFENLKLAVKQCFQTGQKMVENAKIEKFKCDILGDFQTLCRATDEKRRDKMGHFACFFKKSQQRLELINGRDM